MPTSACTPAKYLTPRAACLRLLQGVYQGSVRSAADMVMDGRARSSDFQFISGYSGWDAFQLSAELQDQAW